jgi:hypothetical protein
MALPMVFGRTGAAFRAAGCGWEFFLIDANGKSIGVSAGHPESYTFQRLDPP